MFNYKKIEVFVIKIGDTYFYELEHFRERIITTKDISKATRYRTKAYINKLVEYIKTLTDEPVEIIKIQ